MKVLTVTLNPALDLTVRVASFRQGAVNPGQSLRWNAGGKGVNVATRLAEWAALHGGLPEGGALDVTATGLLGEGNAERFEAHFRGKGVRDAFLRLPGDTRVGVKLVDEAAQQTSDINLPGLTPGTEALAALETRVLALAEPGSTVVLAGSLPPGVDPELYPRLTAELRGLGCTVALDTSGAALMAALRSDVLPDLVKPNIHELEAALGHSLSGPHSSEDEVLEAARELVERGARLVAVSRGEEGALLVTAQEALLARPPRVEVGSTVGAGDAMVAGLVSAGLGLGRVPLAEAARRATAFSLVTITGEGEGLSDLARLRALEEQVQVEPAGMGSVPRHRHASASR